MLVDLVQMHTTHVSDPPAPSCEQEEPPACIYDVIQHLFLPRTRLAFAYQDR